MRIDRIQVAAFGRLEELDTGTEPLQSLVVVLGPNEAGKSTLFTFLTTALYGFQPATRERNPHVPWGSDEAAGSVRVALDQGGCAEVERRLRSQPSAKLTMDGRTTDLRNQAVPWVGHVPRTVFRQVFAITLGELAGLDGDTWARIQDKMIGSMGAADLRSARIVAEALEREAGEIWRPNRRGNQRLRELRDELRGLRGHRTAARDRDTRIRRLVVEREGLHEELQELRERRQLERAEVERVQSVLPAQRRLDRIAALRGEAGPADEIRGLPADPPARFAELRGERAELAATVDALERSVAGRETMIEEAGSVSQVLDRRHDVVRLVATVAGSAPDRVRAVELEGELEDVEARLDAAARGVLSGSWRDVPTEALLNVATEPLRERLGGRQADASPPATARRGSPRLAPWLASTAGLALLSWGLLSRQIVAAVLGAATIATALTWWLTRRPAPRSPSHEDVSDLIAGLPIRPDHRARPGETLVTGLERLRDLARRRAELTLAVEVARERVASADSAARGVAQSLGRDAAADAEAIARDLDLEVRRAERLEEAATESERELPRLRSELERAAERLSEVDAELGRLADRVRALDGEDLGQALERARDRLQAQRRADDLEDELAREHPDLDALRRRIDELGADTANPTSPDGRVALARARIESYDERIEELLMRGEALEGEVERLREQATVDAVDGQISSAKEAEARLIRARDRKRVLAALLRGADRRFREEHQPDLVRRAGSYLHHLTRGRYERLVVDETQGDHPFRLVGPGLPAPVPLAPPVSTGTLEQAYLSLRLAIVDHLDQGGEKLPLFVDEVFVNWDGERRTRGLELLSRIAQTRQVFVFTCHPDVAGELEERGARVLRLDGSRAVG